ncbi:rhamnogalacturonidase [Caulobacter sp. RL271]|uniref:Glycosyl hydrolase family 28 protein n=1 Tax=Caulobacter segnis TaxID=88688 RepID=A0ABY4ZMT4_9CAUL|nr:glycosyl hydrolase family 28 protein [Caulobacter segnis]USQ94117.1 glycosyl hydrolase family 28 protein [Caulobacter segnis]
MTEALATDAINAAIVHAHGRGGGEVVLPAGRHLSFSIRLLSGVTLRLEEGCVLEAAAPAIHGGAYDPAEPNPHDLWQDFGHSHWHNSLIWAEDAEDIAIVGPGRIDGLGLTREGPGSRWKKQAGEFPLSMAGLSAEAMAELSPQVEAMAGLGNKAIAMKRVKRARIEGLTIFRGGHFAVLATGCEDLILRDLIVDTNRDGLDIDACRRVLVSGCRVNTPNDDAIVLKSSLALGERIPIQDVTIEHCEVSGFDPGAMLDGTFGRTQLVSPDQDRVTGRIKLGTESNGGFQNVTIRDCRFVRSRGLALEVVDGGTMENIVCERLHLSEVTTAPIFLRVGDRRRGPEGTPLGAMRNIVLRDIEAFDILPDYAATIAGLPDSPIQNVTLENIRLSYRGGGPAEWAERRPGDLPEAYPEPSMFGPSPVHGLWARHVDGLKIENLTIETTTPDARPERLLENVREVAE